MALSPLCSTVAITAVPYCSHFQDASVTCYGSTSQPTIATSMWGYFYIKGGYRGRVQGTPFGPVDEIISPHHAHKQM